jgi:RNA polymerase sigma factor (sigma-70 family)
MDGSRLQGVIGSLRRAVSGPGGGGLTDADLLGRWVAGRDEAAFEALLWRHAAAVLGVCRRVLGDAHAAEDAAQAAFLALARKAGSIGRRQAVAAWLYSVARRAALQEQTRLARLPAHDPRTLDVLPARTDGDTAWADLRPVLDEEVGRLPEKYRAAFVLCHVEGRTNEEAARELGCPVGTIQSRLARARRRLRDRLTRRGVAPAAGALVLALAGEAAAVPGMLVRGAVRAAALAAAGKDLAGSVSLEAGAIAEGVVRAMLVTKVKAGAAVVLTTVLLVAGGGGVLTYRTVASEPGAVRKVSAVPGAPAGDEEKLRAMLEQKDKEVRLLQARIANLEAMLQTYTQKLETAAARAQQQADRARAAELEARNVADNNVRAAPAPGGKPETVTENAARAEAIQQARDEVELLEAQLAVKKANLDSAHISLEAMKRMANERADPKAQAETATLAGQVQIRYAEMREGEVRLAQAKRRLTRLQGMAASPDGQRRDQLGQRAADLERKLDAMTQELEGLRKEIRQLRPARP